MKPTAVWTVFFGLLLAGLPLWAQYQGQNSPYPGQNAPYPGQNAPYPGQNAPYPGQNAPYPGQHPNSGYGQNPNAGNYPGYGSNMIPEGARFVVRLEDTLDTAKLKPGKKFTAKLAEDLTSPDGSTIPAGKKIHGHVSSVNRGLHGSMLLSFDEIETRHGWRPLAATVTDVPGEHGTKAGGEEGEVQKKGSSGRRVAEGAVIGAAVGAAAGAVTAGPHGAIIGAAAGGALGGGAGILTDRDLKLNKGQQLELRLDRPLQVPR